MTLEMLNLQPRYKEAVWGSEYFMAIEREGLKMFMRRLLPILSSEGPSFLLFTQNFPATSVCGRALTTTES